MLFSCILLAAFKLLPIGPMRAFPITDEGYTQFLFSPDGTTLAVFCYDHETSEKFMTIRMWDVESGTQRFSVRSVPYSRSWCFSPDSRYFAAPTENWDIKLWNTESGKELERIIIKYAEKGTDFCFSPDSKLLATDSSHSKVPGHITFWTIENGQELGTIQADFRTLSLASDGKTAVSYMTDYDTNQTEVCLWQLTSNACPKMLKNLKIPGFFRAVSADLKAVAVEEVNSSIGMRVLTLWEVATATKLCEIGLSINVLLPRRYLFSNRGQILLISTEDRHFGIFDTEAWLVAGEPRLIAKFRGRAAFSPDGHWLAAALPGGAELFSIPSGEKGPRLVNPNASKLGMISTYHWCTFSPDSTIVAVQGLLIDSYRPFFADWPLLNMIPFKSESTHCVRLWAVESGREIHAFENVNQLQFSPDNKYIATDGPNNTIQLWRLPLQKPTWLMLQWAAIIWLGVIVGLWVLAKLWRLVYFLRHRRTAQFQSAATH